MSGGAVNNVVEHPHVRVSVRSERSRHREVVGAAAEPDAWKEDRLFRTSVLGSLGNARGKEGVREQREMRSMLLKAARRKKTNSVAVEVPHFLPGRVCEHHISPTPIRDGCTSRH